MPCGLDTLANIAAMTADSPLHDSQSSSPSGVNEMTTTTTTNKKDGTAAFSSVEEEDAAINSIPDPPLASKKRKANNASAAAAAATAKTNAVVRNKRRELPLTKKKNKKRSFADAEEDGSGGSSSPAQKKVKKSKTDSGNKKKTKKEEEKKTTKKKASKATTVQKTKTSTSSSKKKETPKKQSATKKTTKKQQITSTSEKTTTTSKRGRGPDKNKRAPTGSVVTPKPKQTSSAKGAGAGAPTVHTSNNKKKSLYQPSFPTILMGMMSAPQNSDYITFLSDDTRIIIIHPDAVAKKVLPMHFDEEYVPTYEEFLELFDTWGFEVMTDPQYPQVNVYKHEQFKKGDWEGCLKMTLPTKVVKKTENKKDDDVDVETKVTSVKTETKEKMEMGAEHQNKKVAGAHHNKSSQQQQQQPPRKTVPSSRRVVESPPSRNNNNGTTTSEARSVTPPEMNRGSSGGMHHHHQQQQSYGYSGHGNMSQFSPQESVSSRVAPWMASQQGPGSMLEQMAMATSETRRNLSDRSRAHHYSSLMDEMSRASNNGFMQSGMRSHSSHLMEEMMMMNDMNSSASRPEMMEMMMMYRQLRQQQGGGGGMGTFRDGSFQGGPYNGGIGRSGGGGGIFGSNGFDLDGYSRELQAMIMSSRNKQQHHHHQKMAMPSPMMMMRRSNSREQAKRMSNAEVQWMTQDVVSAAMDTLQRGERQLQQKRKQCHHQEPSSRGDMTEELLGQLRQTINNTVSKSSYGNNYNGHSNNASHHHGNASTSSTSRLDEMTEAFLERSNARRMQSRPVGIHGSTNVAPPPALRQQMSMAWAINGCD